MRERSGLGRFAQCFAERKNQREQRNQQRHPFIVGFDVRTVT
jgi:hypothetical protein